MNVDNEFLVALSLAEPIGFGEVGEHGVSFLTSAESVYLDYKEKNKGQKGDCGLNNDSN